MGIKYYNADLCNGCGICVEDCPMNVFAIDPNTGKATIAYPEDCWECYLYLCESGCPTKAIEITPMTTRKLWSPF